jgi:hypothetical protein
VVWGKWYGVKDLNYWTTDTHLIIWYFQVWDSWYMEMNYIIFYPGNKQFNIDCKWLSWQSYFYHKFIHSTDYDYYEESLDHNLLND